MRQAVVMACSQLQAADFVDRDRGGQGARHEE
jgi:hypothetical protein